MQVKSGDAGLESFLNLIEPNLGKPKMAITPEAISLRLQREEKKDIAVKIKNLSRGYLFGTVDFDKPVEGLSLNTGNFGVHHSDNREVELVVNIDASLMEYGSTYRTSIIINSNAEGGSVSIPLEIEVYRSPFAKPETLWIITLIPVLLVGLLTLMPAGQSSSDVVWSLIALGSGLVGVIIYNTQWSSGAKGRDNQWFDYLLSILCFVGFIFVGMLLAGILIVAIVIIGIVLLLSFALRD